MRVNVKNMTVREMRSHLKGKYKGIWSMRRSELESIIRMKKKTTFKKKKTTSKKKKTTSKKNSTNGKKKRSSLRKVYSRAYSDNPKKDIPKMVGYKRFLYEGITKAGNKSQKFWMIKRNGDFICTSHGAVGKTIKTTCKPHSDPTKELERLIKSKVTKGYRRI